MKIFALYFSPTGGTKKVLDIMISAWDCEKKYIDISDKRDILLDISFSESDICVVAVPTFSGRVPGFVISKLRKLQGNGIKAMLITTYGNRAFDDALLELKDTMESCGFICSCAVAAVTRHSVLPKYGKGRPDFADVEKLKQFSLQCKERILNTIGSASVPGNRPYRNYIPIPIKPKANKRCIGCGLCYQKCPVHAIEQNNYKVCDKSKCISCLQCVAICPKKARKINPIILKIAEIKMKNLCGGRKQNRIFY
ncbi:MAG: 4Fe-4S binding protein [Lachnospiraceae bacterium]|nr:4Fe-4S binding protein [Lachnospiraceae bacterium]